MFDLEKSIADWRKQMLAAGLQTPVPLEELEIHLREEIERQKKFGRSETEAFETAIQNIGQAQAVQNEFGKVKAADEERRWKEGQIWSGAILGLLQLSLISAVLFNSEMNFGQRMSGLAAMATSFLLVAGGRLSHRVFPVIRVRRTRTAISLVLGCAPGIVWFLLFARFFLASHEFPFGEWLAAALWAGAPPLGLSLGLIWGIETAARKRFARAGS